MVGVRIRLLMGVLVAAVAFLIAQGAGAFGIRYTVEYGRQDLPTTTTSSCIGPLDSGCPGFLHTGDTVQVHVYLDAEPGLQVLALAILYDGGLEYDAGASVALPPKGRGESGAQPSYILYSAGKPAIAVYPQQTPAFDPWPNPPAGREQVNVNFAEPGLRPARVGGYGLWIASLVLEAKQPFFTEPDIELSLDESSSALIVYDERLDPAQVPIERVPEPGSPIGLISLATALLLRLGRRGPS